MSDWSLPMLLAGLHEDIQQRAYQLWQTRLQDDIEGTADQDWLAAEQELLFKHPGRGWL